MIYQELIQFNSKKKKKPNLIKKTAEDLQDF